MEVGLRKRTIELCSDNSGNWVTSVDSWGKLCWCADVVMVVPHRRQKMVVVWEEVPWRRRDRRRRERRERRLLGI